MNDGFFILSGRPNFPRSHPTANSIQHDPALKSAERTQTNTHNQNKYLDFSGLHGPGPRAVLRPSTDIEAKPSDLVGSNDQRSKTFDPLSDDPDSNYWIGLEGRGFNLTDRVGFDARLHMSLSEMSQLRTLKNDSQLSLSSGCCGAGHIPINMMGVRKGCVYCQLTKSKTRSGYWVYTRYKCKECEVPLCMPSAERDCFQLYHKYLKDGSLQPPTLFPDN